MGELKLDMEINLLMQEIKIRLHLVKEVSDRAQIRKSTRPTVQQMNVLCLQVWEVSPRFQLTRHNQKVFGVVRAKAQSYQHMQMLMLPLIKVHLSVHNQSQASHTSNRPHIQAQHSREQVTLLSRVLVHGAKTT